jgi:formylglycine-generating enzyme required for sulfatase activity
LRAFAGRTLGRLGDLRPGVSLRKDGLPDVAWCDVPAGEFLMGNSRETDAMADDSETPQHRVTLEGFSVSKYPVTNAQYDAFVLDGGYTKKWQHCWTKDGWRWKGDRSGPDKVGGGFGLANHPVVNVTWYESMAFCRWLGERSALPIALPSEAQWEKAARGIDARRYPWGAEITPEYANYDQTGIRTTSAVGIFPKGQSPYGALDMSGNVWEWCRTKWRDNYNAAADDNPEGTNWRVVRGGSFIDNDRYVRCAFRGRTSPAAVTGTSVSVWCCCRRHHDAGLWPSGLWHSESGLNPEYSSSRG